MILMLLAVLPLRATDIIIDSKMTFKESVEATKAPIELLDSLDLLDVEYYSFDGKLHRGQLLVHKTVSNDVKSVFKIIKETKFAINKCIPIVAYNWSDSASMDDNNSSAFNYRNIAGTNRLSKHSFGKAVDINPFQNPVVYSDGKISPSKAKYSTNAKGTFSADHPVVKEFKRLGWRWGGDFTSFKDYHHFDKE